MKAKEYVAILGDPPNIEAVKKVLFAMIVTEPQELAKKRNVKTDAGMRAILLEQDQKWQAMCRLQPELLRGGFRATVRTTMPEVAQLMNWDY